MQNFKKARKKLSKAFGTISDAASSIDDIAHAISILGAASGDVTTTSLALVSRVFAKGAKGASGLLERFTSRSGPLDKVEDLELIFHLLCQESFFRALHEHIEGTPYIHSQNISTSVLKLQGVKLEEVSTSINDGYISLTKDGMLFAAYSERVTRLLRAVYPAHIRIDEKVSEVMEAAIGLVRRAVPHQHALHAHFQMESLLDSQQRIRDIQRSLQVAGGAIPIASEGMAVEVNRAPLPVLRPANVTDAEAKLAEVCRILSVETSANTEKLAELGSISDSIHKQFYLARDHLDAREIIQAETEFRSVERLLRGSSVPENVALRARSIANLGLIRYRQGKARRARWYFRYAYSIYPDHPNIRSLWALALDIDGRSDKALAFLAEETSGPEPPLGSQQLYVQLLANHGEIEKALLYINDLNSDDPAWVEIRARILMESGKFTDARSILEKAVCDRSTPETKEQLAYCLGFPLVGSNKTMPEVLHEQQKEDLNRAIGLLDEALHSYVSHGNKEDELQTRVNISAFQSRLGRLKDAQQTLNAALARFPSSREALANRFIVHQKLGRHEEARDDARALYAIEESTDSAARFAEALLCLDQFRAVLRFVEECEERLPEARNHPVIQCCKLQALQARHERKQAELHAGLIESKFPDSSFSLYILARYFSSLKMDEKAESLYSAAIERSHGPEKVRVIHDLGLHFYQRSDWSRAKEFLNQYIAEPRDSHLFGEILNCHYQLGDFHQVLLLCEDVDESGMSPLALNVLANTLIVLFQFQRAAEVLECLIDQTRRVRYRLTLAQVYHRLGKLERSENLLQEAYDDDPENQAILIQLSQVAYQLGIHQHGFEYGIEAYKQDRSSVQAMNCVLQVTFVGAGDVIIDEEGMGIVQECRERHPEVQEIEFKENEDGRIDPTPIFEMAREQHRRMEVVLQAYHNYRAPLSTLVDATGGDYWSVWRGMASQRDGKIYMTSGSHAEQVEQLQIATEAKEVVVDASSLLSLQGLGLLDVARSCFERILVPMVTVDEIRNSYNKLKQFSGGGGGGTLVPVEDRFVFVEHSADDWQKEIQEIEQIIRFLEDPKVEIVGLAPEFLKKREIDKQWRSLPESAFFCFAVSQSRRAPLWSDQMAIVQIHGMLDEGKGFCTRAFLSLARQGERISQDQLDDAILWMLNHNYTFVSEQVSTMPRQAKISEYNISEFGRSLVQRIGDESWNNESSSRVFGAAFARIWVSCPREKRYEWIAAVVPPLGYKLNWERVIMNFSIGILLELMGRPAQYFGIFDMLIKAAEENPTLKFHLSVVLRATSGFAERSIPFRRIFVPGVVEEWRVQRRIQASIEALRRAGQ